MLKRLIDMQASFTQVTRPADTAGGVAVPCWRAHLIKGVLLPGGRSRCMGFIAGVALRLHQPGEVILNGLILCWVGGKAVDVRHAVRGVGGGGLAALWQAAAGPRRSGGAQMRLWEAGGWSEDSCGHAMAVALGHRMPIRQPAQGCPDGQRMHHGSPGPVQLPVSLSCSTVLLTRLQSEPQMWDHCRICTAHVHACVRLYCWAPAKGIWAN